MNWEERTGFLACEGPLQRPRVQVGELKIRGPGVALGLVTPFACAARTVLRGALRGFAAVLVARIRRGVGYRLRR